MYFQCNICLIIYDKACIIYGVTLLVKCFASHLLIEQSDILNKGLILYQCIYKEIFKYELFDSTNQSNKIFNEMTSIHYDLNIYEISSKFIHYEFP